MSRRLVVGLALLGALAEATFLLLFAIDYFGARKTPLWEPSMPTATGNEPQHNGEEIRNLNIWVGRLTGIEYGVTRTRTRPETASS